MKEWNWIVEALPYGKEFLFVDKIEKVDERGIIGNFTFAKDAWYYEHHFPGHPVTPGVLLVECMAQFGLVAFGIFLMGKGKESATRGIAFSEQEVIFHKDVPRGTKVKVRAEKIYFRLGKLKVKVRMESQKGIKIAEGKLSGMIKS